MKRLEEKPEIYIATAAKMLDSEGMAEAATVLRSSSIRVEETGYDSWNGGTRIWTVFLELDADEFARLGSSREALEQQIDKRLKPVVERFTDDWFRVKITPRTTVVPDWRETSEELPAATRRNIIDGLRNDEVAWWGRLDEVEFLERLYDLESLQSFDPRFKTASEDIWQHRVNNFDGADDWVYSDCRFDLVSGPSDRFLRFLCEMVHPDVRPDRNEALRLVSQFNDQLRLQGWNLVEEEKIAGRPRFVPKKISVSSTRSVSRARTVADALNAGWMQKEIERMENAVEPDPALAIGTAKDLVESCCKTILQQRGVDVPKSANMPQLTKMLASELKLVPEGISDEARGAETIRLILKNLSALSKYLAELRGLYGSGHGRDGKHRGLEPRHARLAAGASIAFIVFVTDTYQVQDERCSDD